MWSDANGRWLVRDWFRRRGSFLANLPTRGPAGNSPDSRLTPGAQNLPQSTWPGTRVGRVLGSISSTLPRLRPAVGASRARTTLSPRCVGGRGKLEDEVFWPGICRRRYSGRAQIHQKWTIDTRQGSSTSGDQLLLQLHLATRYMVKERTAKGRASRSPLTEVSSHRVEHGSM